MVVIVSDNVASMAFIYLAWYSFKLQLVHFINKMISLPTTDQG